MTPSKKQQWMTGPTFSIDDVIDPALSSDSSAATSTAKRKRASKPKVRTGCITWIRRVKCDETKPACTRCTSTGRKCDGYDGQAPPRRKKLPPPSTDAAAPNSISGMEPRYLAKRHELARHSFAAACRGNSALRVLRPLAADIEGTEQERQVFHQFRRYAEAGLAMHAASLGPGFWQRLVPQLGHSDAAVRHALIALGASYQSAQLQQEQGQGQGQHFDININDRTATPAGKYSSRGSSPDEKLNQQQRYASIPIPTPSQPDNSSRHQRIEQLELFAIQQYNLSIYHLQRHVQPESPPESVEITLVCCLVFVCVETSRGNEAGALSHVANGLQIIKTMPSELTRTSGNSSGSSAPTAIRMSRSDWRQLLDFFLALEPNVVAYEGLTTPRCPSVDMWTPPSTDYFGEMPAYWEADIETWS